MNEEELRKQLEEELQWVIYRQKILVVIEDKLLDMRSLAQQARNESITKDEIDRINHRLNKLAQQVTALEEESRRI